MNHGGGIRTNRASIQLAKETAIETYRNDDDQSDDHRQVGLKVPTEPTGYAEAIDCIEHISFLRAEGRSHEPPFSDLIILASQAIRDTALPALDPNQKLVVDKGTVRVLIAIERVSQLKAALAQHTPAFASSLCEQILQDNTFHDYLL